jgi:hypothetical protein
MKHAAGYALISMPLSGKTPDRPQSINHKTNAFIYSWNEALEVRPNPSANSLPNGKKK